MKLTNSYMDNYMIIICLTIITGYYLDGTLHYGIYVTVFP